MIYASVCPGASHAENISELPPSDCHRTLCKLQAEHNVFAQFKQELQKAQAGFNYPWCRISMAVEQAVSQTSHGQVCKADRMRSTGQLYHAAGRWVLEFSLQYVA